MKKKYQKHRNSFHVPLFDGNDWIVKLGLEFIKVNLFSILRYSSLSITEYNSKFDTHFKVHIIYLFSFRETTVALYQHTWKKVRRVSQFTTLNFRGMFFFALTTFTLFSNIYFSLPIELTVLRLVFAIMQL